MLMNITTPDPVFTFPILTHFTDDPILMRFPMVCQFCKVFWVMNLRCERTVQAIENLGVIDERSITLYG